MNKKIGFYLPIIATVIAIIIAVAIVIYQQNNCSRSLDQISQYILEIKAIEHAFITALPLYTDFSTNEKRKKLRKHLINDHLVLVRKMGLSSLKNNEELQKAIKRGEIVSADRENQGLFYFYNLPKENRFLRKNALQCLVTLTLRMQDILATKGNFPGIKIALSSMVRPTSYHNMLKKTNSNAADHSSHSYGMSFDIFYDDYYIKLPEPQEKTKLATMIIERFRVQMGFLLGRSLRRQIRSLLAEALIQLQDEGILYVIEENIQRCYHVTSLIPDHLPTLR